MLNNRFAIIDIGTNTFHLIIVDVTETGYTLIKREREAVRLGQGGIDKKMIAPDAMSRAFFTLKMFKELGKTYRVSEYIVNATSAVRNAENRDEFISMIHDKIGLNIQVVDGAREAELIYKGVKLADGVLSEEPSLIVDIGGGSVEFIVANKEERLWMQSFEIGGQRLKNAYHTEDPISKKQLLNLENYLQEQLKPVAEAVKKYKPTSLVGCSGTFDTILEIEQHRTNLENDSFNKSFFNLIYQELIAKDRSERLSIPGMIMMRVDLIVVSACIINHVFKATGIGVFKVCRNALKEGVLYEILNEKSVV